MNLYIYIYIDELGIIIKLTFPYVPRLFILLRISQSPSYRIMAQNPQNPVMFLPKDIVFNKRPNDMY